MLTKIIRAEGSMAVCIPEEFNAAPGDAVIRQVGERWIIEPVHVTKWPEGFFEAIRIDDPAFARPEQGEHRDVQLG